MKEKSFSAFPGGRIIGKEELDEVTKVIKSRSPYRFYGLDLQKYTEKLEKVSCGIFSRKYSLALSSGTAALHAALFSLGISKGDEVILPQYAWISDLMAILAVGAVPVMAPIDETLNLDVSLLEGSITPKTRAIIGIHMRGYPCDMKKICDLALKYNLKVIEDGAQCIGGTIEGSSVGSFGDISVLSFQYNKLVTCGEGGMLLTNDEKLYKKAYRFHDLGMLRHADKADPEGPGSIACFGLNYRLSELQAAFLTAQLKKMDNLLKALQCAHEEALKNIKPITEEFGLSERQCTIESMPNHAFLCMIARKEQGAIDAYEALRKIDVPVQKCSRIDGHHFNTWKEYMSLNKKSFRLYEEKISEEILKRALFVEVRPF